MCFMPVPPTTEDCICKNRLKKMKVCLCFTLCATNSKLPDLFNRYKKIKLLFHGKTDSSLVEVRVTC